MSVGQQLMDQDEKPSPLPRWWLDGTAPLAIGVAAALIALVLFAGRRGGPPHDAFGTLVPIALIANLAAYDNTRGAGGVRPRVAIGAFALALGLGVAVLL
jgi:hypothetical protein